MEKRASTLRFLMYISDDHREMLADVLPPGVDPLPVPETREEAWELLLELMRVSGAWKRDADIDCNSTGQ